MREHELIWRDTSRMDWISNYVRGEHMFQEREKRERDGEREGAPFQLPPVLTAARSTQTLACVLMTEVIF